MKKLSIRWQIGLCTLGTSLCIAASASDIYRSEHPDGTPRYASQPLDSSYSLYLESDRAPESIGFQPKASGTQNKRRTALEPLIKKLAQKHAVDPALVRAIIDVESRFNPLAQSPKGAVGAMQLMPATAARYGVQQRTDPTQNIDAGIRYLKDLLALHKGNVVLALASYNAGEGTVQKHGRRIPPYRETMLYVPAVLARLQAIGNDAAP